MIFSKVLLLIALLITDNVFAGKVFENRLNYQIIVPDNATKIQQFAASELKKILAKTYEKSIVLNGETNKITFLVGFSNNAVLAGFTNVPSMKGKFGIFRKKTFFLFFGEDYKNLDPANSKYYCAGTLSAVYYFLTKYTGTNFYLPGDKGYCLNPERQLVFKGTADIPKPSFDVRGIYHSNQEFSQQELNIFARRNLCNLPFWSKADYSYYYINRWKKRFWKTHSDYFMQRDGKAVCAGYPWHVPCFNNPAVIKQTAADIINTINRKPSIRVVKIFCDAPIHQCNCSRCKAAPERSYCGKDINQGEEFYGFQKKVIDLVHEAFPDVYFISQTKGNSYCYPPKMIKMGPLFSMEVLTPRPLPQKKYPKFVKLVKEWNVAGVKTILKSYPRYPAFKDYPIINAKFTQGYLKHFVKLSYGTYHSDLSGNAPYAFCARGQFIQARLLFDVNANVNRLSADFCHFAYPGAEKEMIAFYDEMENLFAKNKNMWTDPLTGIYSFDKLKKTMQLLDAASKKVKKDSPWFQPLEKAFKKFYAEAEVRKEQSKVSLENNLPKTLVVPMLKTKVTSENKLVNKSSQGRLKEKFYPLKPYVNFQKSYACIASDKEYLYLSLIAFENNIKSIKQRCKKNHNGSIWNDDCFEIMLAPNEHKSLYYQIIVNSLGIYRIFLRDKKQKWPQNVKLDIHMRSRVEKDRWLLEFKIPLKQFVTNNFKHKWLFNIFRTRPGKNNKPAQSSGLRIFGSSYHNLKQYQYLSWSEINK